ncbi:immunity Imm1 family protein [Burkholderia cenocepacia]|uniref:Immunity Imm1 family protein n=1 Tax=Burkholderia cenocepacia TaxID=95486 RepID=A0AAN0RYG4_9BURK|nr:immunity Imm1 family protein [Burkholderia cenocepacia]
MQLVKIIKERYIGNRSDVTEQEYGDAAQVISAVGEMNGEDCTSVVFSTDDETVFSAGGGDDNRYVAFLAIATDDTFFTLIDPDKPDGECVDLVVGGQRGSYPMRQCVARATVIQAALHFCQFGKPDPSLNWQEG